MSKQPPTTPPDISTLRRMLQRLLRLLGSIVVTFIIMLILSYFLIQIPAVQTWAAQQVTDYLSEELETTVSVEGVSISLFDQVNLESVYIEDQSGDTLLYANTLAAEFNTDLYTILQGSLEVEGLNLENAYLSIRRDTGSYVNNMQFILDYFAKPKDTNILEPQAKPFDLNVKHLDLINVRFRQRDAVNGKDFYIKVPIGIVELNELNIPNKRLDITSADLTNPTFQVVETEGNPLPELPVNPDDIIEIQTPDSIYLDTVQWVITVDNFELEAGDFELHNYRNNPIDADSKEILDYAHLELFNINIDIEELTYTDWDWQATIGGISFEEKTGFVLEELSADTAHLSPQTLEFYGLNLQTPYTSLGDTLIFTYNKFPDFRDFPNRVRMDLRFDKGSKVKMEDIMTFAPNLERNRFFIQNRDRIIDINGRVYGRVNNLKGRDLTVQLDDGTLFKGDFSTRDLNDRNNEFVNLTLEEFTTSVSNLRDLIPDFNPPPNFSKLGDLNFKGRFTGFFADFVAEGELKTNLGSATTDMRLDLKEGRNVAKYSGTLALNNFDLARWSDNPDFGKVTFTSEVKNGIGLTAKEASANLIANITRFPFKGYAYENATFNGQLNQNLFDGDFSIKDDNIDFTFEGRIDVTDSIPKLDFQASVNRLAMQPLNLSQQDYILGGNIDLQIENVDLALLEGRVDVGNFSILHNQQDRYVIDTVKITSNFDANNQRDFRIQSDILDSKIIGEFDIEKLPETFLQFFTRNYPEFADRFGIQSKTDSLYSSHFTYDLQLKDSKGLNYLINPKLDSIRNVQLNGKFDGRSNEFDLKLLAPAFKFGNIYLEDIAIGTDAVAEDTYMDLVISKIVLNNKQEFEILEVRNHLERDTMAFAIFHEDTTAGFIKKLDLNGQFFLSQDSMFQVTFNSQTNSNIALGSDNWDIEKNNYIRFGKGRVETQNFELTDGKRQVLIESYKEKGLALLLNNMDFGFINDVWVFPKLDLQGGFDFKLSVEDVFKLEKLEAKADMDSLTVNGDYYGAVNLRANAPNIRSAASAKLEITKGAQELLAVGYYNLPNFQPSTPSNLLNKQPNYFNFNLKVDQYPVNFLEYLIGDAISNTVGKFDIDAQIFGQPKRPDITGKLRMYDTAVTLDYLNLRMFVDDDTAIITSTMIDASGGVIKDRSGNIALVKGGLTHNHLKDWGFNASVTTQKFVGLDTKKGDNPVYYGKGIGYGTVQFTGNFKRPNIDADITAAAGSELFIPVSSTYETGEVSFIRFVDKNKVKTEEADNSDGFFSEIKGLSFSMDLSITDEAKMELIFDEQAGDIIKGRGTGNIQMFVPRGGELSMYGDFEIAEGEYLFTLLNFINKPFVVREGGTIRWNGDPFNAKIKLIAEYKNLSTPIANFIQEYLQSTDERILRVANRPTDVDLEMILSGDLLKPTINFDIDFPNLNGQIRTYAETKMRTLIADQNELNRQVFGLIVLGQFLPSEYNFSGGDLAFNTFTEMLSSQFSILVTELLSEVLDGNNVIRNIDFDFAYSRYDGTTTSVSDISSFGTELQAQVRSNIFNDKFSIIIGGNLDLQNGNSVLPNNGAFFGNDFVLEYYLNEKRTLKVRVYQRLDQDFATGTELQFGGGLSYRQDFDSFRELWRKLLNKDNTN